MIRGSALMRFVGISLITLVLIALASGATAQESVTVQLDTIGDSGVTGTITLTAAGEGTDVTLDVEGLAASAEAQATKQAGTCDMPSASFATLPTLTADAAGRATATGEVLFRGTEDVALVTMTDGEHIIAIQMGEEVVACGVIPTLSSAPTAPVLPETGAARFPLAAAGVGVLGLGALSAGLYLWRRRRRGRAR
jgi:LPXTG-motif cell wall-anchored protein